MVKNIARVKINGESCMALLDNGAQIKTITPKYVGYLRVTLVHTKKKREDQMPTLTNLFDNNKLKIMKILKLGWERCRWHLLW